MVNGEPVRVEAVGWQAPRDPAWAALRWKALLDRGRGAREFVFGLAEVAPGGRLPPHAHRQAEVVYVVSGRARVTAGDAAVEVGPGACVYHPPGIGHGLEAAPAGPLRYLRTFACERLGQPVRPRRRRPGPAIEAGREQTAAWRVVEPGKGLTIRVKRLLDRGVEVMAGIAEFDPGVHYTRHFHDQPEVYFVLAGTGIVHTGRGEVPVGPGAALYLASREVHGVDSLGHEPLRLFWVYGCETAGHRINWTPVEPVDAPARQR